jgi:hypothetical protein
MSEENRLTAEQLAALAPGDTVTIESGSEFGRRRLVTGTVGRITATHVAINCGRYVECYGLHDGIRDGGAGRAELVNDGLLQEAGRQSRARRINRLYREWARNRTDLERLQRLQEATGEVLDESATSLR